jgi:hypothetical protein
MGNAVKVQSSPDRKVLVRTQSHRWTRCGNLVDELITSPRASSSLTHHDLLQPLNVTCFLASADTHWQLFLAIFLRAIGQNKDVVSILRGPLQCRYDTVRYSTETKYTCGY